MNAHRYAHWKLTDDEKGIIWLGLDQSETTVNTLGSSVLEELATALDEIGARNPRALVIHSLKESGFAAGADVKEFTQIQNPTQAYQLVRRGQEVLNRLASAPYPTVAMMRGFALGGGLELALACRYRVVADASRSQLGFPEIKLGIHPGFGGTVRSVATIGVTKALELMLTGKSVAAREAVALGLADKLANPTELRERATNLALGSPPVRRAALRERLLALAPLRPLVASGMRRRVARRVRKDHYPAPFALISLWEKHGGRVEPQSFEAEARSIAGLMCSDTARNLVRVFFLRERLKNLGRKRKIVPRRIHVIGAGTMGGDIAAWCAMRGIETTLQDRKAVYVQNAISRARTRFEHSLKDSRRVEEALARLHMDLDGDAVGDADLVIEAIFEDADAKAAVFRRIEPLLGEETVLATNTSSIPLETLGASLADPGRLVGMHFFNPVAKMPLVEVISTHRTDPAVRERALSIVGNLGKLPVPVRSSPGFLVNRILAPYLAVGLEAWNAGVAPEAIDRAAEDFGMPMGPVELADTVGLDVALSVAALLRDLLRLAPPPPKLQELVEAGHLGRKSGRGLYVWRNGKPDKDESRASGEDRTLQDRLILPLLNEAVRCLRERIVDDEELLDAGVVFGTGFAPFRGGPIHYVRQTGAAQLKATFARLAERFGDVYRPDPGWDML